MARNLFLALSFLLIISCSSDKTSNRPAQNLVIPAVEAVQSQYGSLPLVERFSGNVISENQIELYPEINAQIAEVYAENGDRVTKGQILVRLQDEPLKKQLQQAEAGLRINEARLKQAEARLTELEGQFKRISALAEKNLSSEVQIEQINAQKASAEADVSLARAQIDQAAALVEERKIQLSKTVIRSPITGTVGQKNARMGMQASAGTKIFTIGDLSRLRIEIVLTENMLSRIKVGQTATIATIDDNGEPKVLNAKLSRISPFLNEITRSTEAEIDVDNTDGLLKPGMYVPVDIHFGESQQATLLPTSAIFIDPKSGKEGIFIANSIGSEIKPVSDTSGSNSPLTEPTAVTFQEIDIIARGKMEVGVLGLESGKWVVTLGQNLLAEGKDKARVRTITWEHVLRLQRMQKEDLLNQIMGTGSNSNNNGLTL
ncbi:MAG: efflux RND transporter periplasmic adaptor subunit [Balneolaceae bacterium]